MPFAHTKRSLIRLVALFIFSVLFICGASAQIQQPQIPGSLPGSKNAGKKADAAPSTSAEHGDSKSSAASTPKDSASGKDVRLGPLDPASAPAKVFARPIIGLALGGGGALALSEVGVLEWFEKHHVPVDVIAGTSMGCMVSALYSTGRTPAQLTTVLNDRVFTSVFSFSNAYSSRSFRRREDSRELPNGISIGLRHRISFRNSVLTDQGLNAFLDRQFLRYDDQTEFNTLPIPLRCMSTDLNGARPVTFARGSIPDAVRASVSLPGVYQPFELNGHEYVDGGVLENLPTRAVHSMQADVVLAVSLPLSPLGKGELGSVLSVLRRSFSVVIEAAEREQRKLADVVMMPDVTGFGPTDYLKTADLAKRGYAAAEQHSAELLRYALNDADWQAYLNHRASLRRGPAGPVLRVRVTAPSDSTTIAVQRLFAPLVNKPVDTAKIEALLDQVRADGRYDADYTVGYETSEQLQAQATGAAPIPSGTVAAAIAISRDQLSDKDKKQMVTEPKIAGAANPKAGTAATNNQPRLAADESRPGATGLAATRAISAESLADIASRPILLITVADKKTGPPFLVLGANLQAQTTALTRATVEGILLNQDFGSYGSELRTHIKLGYMTQLDTEYFHPINFLASPEHTLFAAPHAGLLREPFPIYMNQVRLADRQLQRFNAGADVGWTNQRTQELRAGYDYSHVSWQTIIGADSQPNYAGTSQRARVQYAFDTQDRALVPQFGLHLVTEAAYLFQSVGSKDAPQLAGQASYARRFSLHRAPLPQPGTPVDPQRGHEVLVLAVEGGTMFHRNVAEPFRYTLGGPLRLSASAIDEYRGTDYFLLEPALLRRIAQLPQPLGQNIYLGVGFEYGHVEAPGRAAINRQDVFFGIVAETPLGVVTLAPAIGSNGERKFIFTLGKLF